MKANVIGGNVSRRAFVAGMAALPLAEGCRSFGAADASRSVFISDLHVGGANPRLDYTHARLEKVVDEILALKPKRVVCFGDIALTFGLEEDYAVSRPILKRIEDAGIALHFTMGNHDRRSAFFKYWPECLERPLVPGRCTRVIDLGSADLVLLDTLKGTDDRARNDMGPVDGTIDAAQLEWFDGFVATAKRPFFVGSHQFRDLYLDGKDSPLDHAVRNRLFVGWIYGHEHTWLSDLKVASWKKPVIVPTLTLPSTGLWGDIGYVTFETHADGATAELFQDDFYFTTPTSCDPRPPAWDVRVADNRGQRMRFAYPI